MAEKNYITPEGARKLREELASLHEERTKVVEVVAWAASNGDRSENADYQYGKRRLRQIDGRVRFLIKRLEAAEIVDPATRQSDRAFFGATVTVRDKRGEREYTIVGTDQSDPKRGHISWQSPLGRALLNAKAGSVVTTDAPGGKLRLEIIAVRYQPE